MRKNESILVYAARRMIHGDPKQQIQNIREAVRRLAVDYVDDLIYGQSQEHDISSAVERLESSIEDLADEVELDTPIS